MIDWSKVRHFKREEFGYADGVKPDPLLVSMLDNARLVADIPFQIASGIRSREHNDRIGGSPTSAHLTGHAADIKCTTSRQRFIMLNALIEAGFTRIGVYDRHIHVDTDQNKPDEVIWMGKSV